MNIKILFAREHWLEIASIIVVGLFSFLFYTHLIPLLILLVGMAFGLYPLGKTALAELFTEHKIGTELFITVAVIVSVLGHEYLAGAIVLMIILLAEYIASVSGERARASIRSLLGQAPKTAIVKIDGYERTAPISEIKIGDIVLARTGDRIPVDGIVVDGDASVNQAPITGENMPQAKATGSSVYAGTIVETGALDIRVDKLAEDTVFAKIIALVEEAESKQAPIQKFTDKIATWLIPVVFVFVAIVYFSTRDVKLIIALLIFTSPAELGLATPLVTIAAIARAAREGILVKGGLYLEGLAKVDTFVFDKTGTLTIGSPVVRQIEVIDKNVSEADVIKFAASVDRRSNHPLAQAIVAHAKEKNMSFSEPKNFQVIKGRGVKAIVDSKTVLLGNKALMEENHISIPHITLSGTETIIFLATAQKVVAVFHLSDAVRPGAKETIEKLRESGVENIILLTGDNADTAKHVGSELGITDVRANLLPEDKIRIIESLQKEGAHVAMIGDGVNDAPALAQATVGIAMGAIGTEAAMEAADIVLMNDDLTRISKALAISKRAYRTIQENIFVGVGVVHVTGIILVLLKIIGPVEAAAIHLVPDLLVFLNSTKLLKVKIT
ncbi:MAG: cadmium-translocating P-type ATPase [Candidatus Yonathbacteria bacterium]|nr:cadmium-translocating P-type ATPase [Candidatus Yonathbacteria bacterium]